MKEIEALLQRDRAAGVPEPPDVRYTVAAVNRRLGKGPGPAAPAPRSDFAWMPAVASLCLLAGAVAGICLAGINPWWLAVIPLAVLVMTPILLRKGA